MGCDTGIKEIKDDVQLEEVIADVNTTKGRYITLLNLLKTDRIN